MNLDKISIDKLPGTSAITIRKFRSLNINTYFDLLNYFPSRYEDYSLVTNINSIQVGEVVTVKGKILSAKNQYTRSHITIQKIVVADDTGEIDVTWFNQPYLMRVLYAGQYISISGVVKQFGSKISIEPKEYEVAGRMIHTGRLVPIYPEKKGLSTKTVREKIYSVLSSQVEAKDEIKDFLPEKIINFNKLMNERKAYAQIHFPDNLDFAERAKERLSFDELFNLQLGNSLIKRDWSIEKVTNRLQISSKIQGLIKKFIESLPFELTGDQKRVSDEILSDLKKTVPMNRFLQGDVGSGKTVVAGISCYLSFLNGYKSIIMAPTEILANQHFETFGKLFQNNKEIKIFLITGTTKIKNLQSTIDKSDIIIGTHALLNKNNRFKKVGLVVIDEQHRFGVNQRALIKEKAANPHLLTMTATPIPRTVALTLYGELDQSYIEEMPKGRQIIKTYLIPKEKRADGYAWIKKQIKEMGAQVFIVCPLIDESESETLKSVKAVKIEFESLKKIFQGFKLGLLHGKIKNTEKQKIMFDFKNSKIDILVSTPVVEVGIDIPGATIMVIEGAERYGLAALHQLRGRVGRSDKQSYCFLYSDNLNEKIIKRLSFFCKNNLGIRLAEFDLKNRGAGNIFGTKQHGFVSLKIASLYDFELVAKTKKAVEFFMDNYRLRDYDELLKRVEVYRSSLIAKD